jgi:hypothetical protein
MTMEVAKFAGIEDRFAIFGAAGARPSAFQDNETARKSLCQNSAYASSLASWKNQFSGTYRSAG